MCSFIFVFGISAVGQTVGQTAEPWMRDKRGRQNQTKQWRNEFVRLNAQIPTLSPAEERWLKTEVTDTIESAGGRYTSRSLAAMDSREYQISVAKPHVQQIIDSCDQLLILIPLGNERLEAAQWTKVAALFIDKGFWQAVDNLIRLKIIEGKINGLNGLYYEKSCVVGTADLEWTRFQVSGNEFFAVA
jgi:hypothetical protein